MNYKIVLDAIVYIIAPILTVKFVDVSYLTYSSIALIVLGLFYTMLTKYKQRRVSISGIVFMSLCLLLIIFRQGMKSRFEIYIQETYFFILFAGLISILGLFRKNICNQIYTDILKSKGHSDLRIYSIIKKNELGLEFNELSSLMLINLISVSFIRVYSIATYNKENYLITSQLETVIILLFILAEWYIVSKIIAKSKRKSYNSKNDTKNKLNDKRVINLNQYKNINK